ncbi:MAG: PAS domain S-box protein [Pseudomonadota bacterium]
MAEKPTYEALKNKVIALEKQLVDSRDEKYRILFEKSKDAILIIENKKFVDCNRSTVEMLGYTSKEELLNTHPSELSPEKQPDGRDSFSKAIEMMDLAIQNGSHRFEWNHRKANGEIIPVEVLLTSISADEKNQIIHTIWRDISDRKKAENAIKEEKETLSMILEGHPHGIAMMDEKGHYIYINPYFTKLTGYTLQDIPSRDKWFEKAYPDNRYRRSVVESWVQDSLKQGEGPSREFTVTCKDGRTKNIEFRSTALRDKVTFVLTDVTRKRDAERALRENQKRLSAHLQNTPVGAVSWDLDFKVNEWNPAAERIFGYTRKEALGRHASELIVSVDLKDRIEGVFTDLLAGRGGERSINENRTKNGKKILCDWYNTVVRNDDGAITGVASLVNDITERKRSEDINRTLFAISNAVNITLNLQELYKQIHCFLGEIIDVTNFFIAILSKQKNTLYFPYYVDTVDEDFSPITDFNPKNSLTGFVVSNRKPVLLKKEQLTALSQEKGVWGPVPLIWMGVPLMIKDDVIGVMAVQSYTNPDLYNEKDLKVLSSISDQVAIAIDRKQTDEELRESEKKYRYLFNHAPAGMYEIDFATPRFTEVNAILCQYTGYSEKELLSMDPLTLLTEKSRQTFIQEYKKAIRNEKLSDVVEYDIIGKNGHKLCVTLTNDFIYKDGRLTGARVVAHDITERKKMEKMIIQSEKMMSVGGLAAGMAHEINNPLAGMIQSSQVLRNRLTRDIPANSEIAEELGLSMAGIKAFMEKRGILEQLDNIHKAGQRAAKIIENVLSFAKKSDSKKSDANLAELINKTIELAENDYDLEKKFDFRKLRIIRDYDPEVPNVPCEASKIQQVLFNILKNASEAMHQDNRRDGSPTITLRLKRSFGVACIEIEDNGPGMDNEIRKRIFEPFFTTKSVDKGTGLGLSVSYFIIVNDHKGEMVVESTPGKGTKFIIRLPFE